MWPPISANGLRVKLRDGRDAVVKVTIGGDPAPERIETVAAAEKAVASEILAVDTYRNAVPREMLPRSSEAPGLSILDHPHIGGKFTICVLCFGDNITLAKRCIGSILDNIPQHRIDLRVALNQPSQDLADYVYGFPSQVITKIYCDNTSRKKYPAMREMFWDSACPITTKYLLWFDDDSHVVASNWAEKLGQCIADNHANGCRLYGVKYLHNLMPYKRLGFNPEKWFHEADWWENRWMHLPQGDRIGPNGHVISFVSGGFWALDVATMRKANIPDVRLNHNGGDCTIGEQVHQAGGKIKDFCRGKTPVRYSDAPRRGFREDFPWAKYIG